MTTIERTFYARACHQFLRQAGIPSCTDVQTNADGTREIALYVAGATVSPYRVDPKGRRAWRAIMEEARKKVA